MVVELFRVQGSAIISNHFSMVTLCRLSEVEVACIAYCGYVFSAMERNGESPIKANVNVLLLNVGQLVDISKGIVPPYIHTLTHTFKLVAHTRSPYQHSSL